MSELTKPTIRATVTAQDRVILTIECRVSFTDHELELRKNGLEYLATCGIADDYTESIYSDVGTHWAAYPWKDWHLTLPSNIIAAGPEAQATETLIFEQEYSRGQLDVNPGQDEIYAKVVVDPQLIHSTSAETDVLKLDFDCVS